MVVYTDHAGHTILVLGIKTKKVEFITHKHGHRTVTSMPHDKFYKTYKQLDKSPLDLAEVWLKSPLKMTDRVRKELEMASEEQVEKKETRFPFIPADSTFKALDNQRKHGDSLRTRVYLMLQELGTATAADIAEELHVDAKVAISNLRSLVADKKAEVV